MGAILVWPGAIAIGVSLGLLGSGGSILTLPVLVYLVGQDEKVAVAGSLAIVGLIALVGSLSYIKERLVDWRNVWFFGVPGMAGTAAGAWGSGFVSGGIQLAAFAVLMLTAAIFMLRTTPEPSTTIARRPLWQIGTDGVLVGAVTGFVGVGGGFLIVPALVMLGGLPMHRAVATSLVIIALKSAVGFITYQNVLASLELSLDYEVIAVVAVLGIIGSFIGAQAAQRLSKAKLQRGFGFFLIVVGSYVFVNATIGLL